jgi:tetratricopeptide (TPR) repeat protein
MPSLLDEAQEDITQWQFGGRYVCHEDSFWSISHRVVPDTRAYTTLFSSIAQGAHYMVARPSHRAHVDRPILSELPRRYELGRCRHLLFVSHAWRLLRLAVAHDPRDEERRISLSVDYLGFKGNVLTVQLTRIWTSSVAGNQQYFSVFMGPPDVFGILFKAQFKAALNPDRSEAHERVSKVSDRNGVLCARPLDANILQFAQDARVSHPIPDLLTLKANVPLNMARLSFQAGRYQDAIAQSQGALAIKPDFADAYWGIGISYGMLGQWDQAISNLESALKIDKGDGDAKDSLQWAKDNQKAAKHDKTAKDKPPIWK